MSWFVYIVECNDGTYYTGSTNNVVARIAAHNGEGQGKSAEKAGAKYTRGKRPVQLRHTEEYPDKSSAMKREWEIKRMRRAHKELLFSQQNTKA